jgi:hypothetical protein
VAHREGGLPGPEERHMEDRREMAVLQAVSAPGKRRQGSGEGGRAAEPLPSPWHSTTLLHSTHSTPEASTLALTSAGDAW